DDIGMVEPRLGLRFGEEAIAELRLLRQLGSQLLDGHGPSQVLVNTPVDDAHPPAAERRFDTVLSDMAPHEALLVAALEACGDRATLCLTNREADLPDATQMARRFPDLDFEVAVAWARRERDLNRDLQEPRRPVRAE